MPRRTEDEYRALIEPVARQLLGDPNPAHSTRDELRWGTNGSLAVDLPNGRAYDHEQKEGGGTLWLIGHVQLVDLASAGTWLDANFPAAEEPTKPNGHDRSPNPIVQTYDYVDADRTLLSQVCRKAHPKTFLQRRPKPGGGWLWETRGVKAVPYRLPELMEAIAAGRTIYIVEGEKDVDALIAAGLASTTNIGGCGKWRPALNQYFQGADLVVIGDHDPQAKDPHGEPRWHEDGRPVLPGQDHATDVAHQLAPAAKRLRLLRDLGDAWGLCPPKGDVSDYLEDHTAADLEVLAAALPDYGEDRAPWVLPNSFKVASLAGKPVPPRLWHVPDLVPAKTVTLLGGDGGIGKSILGLQLAFATAAGLKWIGQQVRQGPALHLSAEDDDDELHFRDDQVSTFYGTPLEDVPDLTQWSLADQDAVLVIGRPGEALEPTDRWQELQRYVELDRPALVVLDSLADVYGGNENDRAQVRAFVRMLRGLAKPAATAIVLLGHPSLTGLSTGSGLSGSTGWNNSVRSRLYMAAPVVEEGGTVEPNLRTLGVKKANYTQAGAELRLRWIAGAFDLDDETGSNALDQQNAADRVNLLFLEMLDAFTAEGRTVSHLTGRNYAPAAFAADPRARSTTSKGFAGAMNRLFAASRIRVATRGPPSHQISFLARAPERF